MAGKFEQYYLVRKLPIKIKSKKPKFLSHRKRLVILKLWEPVYLLFGLVFPSSLNFIKFNETSTYIYECLFIYSLSTSVISKEGLDFGLKITLVPKVLKSKFYWLVSKLWVLLLNLYW